MAKGIAARLVWAIETLDVQPDDRLLEIGCGHGVAWVHVDYEPHLRGFYQGCGFRPTETGLIRLDPAGSR